MVAFRSFDEQAAFEETLKQLQALRRFEGPPAEFWPALVGVLARLGGASRCLLIRRDPQDASRLLKLAEWSDNGRADGAVMAFNRSLPRLVDECARQPAWLTPLEDGLADGNGARALGVRLQLAGEGEHCAAALLWRSLSEPEALQAAMRLQLAADLPAAYQIHQSTQRAQRDVEKFASVLDVLAPVNAERRFRAAALAFCNGIAERFGCERVSLGWFAGDYVRLKAISRTERFDKQMEAVRAIEVVMEEAFDQDEEVIWPAPEGAGVVARDHQAFAGKEPSPHLVSLPLRVEQRAVAVLTCERATRPFVRGEIEQLRLACDTVVRRLADLERTDRWFGSRWAQALKERAAKLVGPEHTWAKVGALLGAVALVALLLPIYPYRVEGNFILRSDEVSYLTAPFDGYIRTVAARPGDVLSEGGLLLELNTDQLVLEEASALADQTRYLREVEKARANRALAEMRIAQALAEEAQARLDLVRYRLEQARIRSPFNGVVAEGNLRERIGAPVRQGEALFRVARLDRLYVEAEINERDVHEIVGASAGEIAFLAQPRIKFPVQVEQLEPAAVPKEKENVFLVRCALENAPAPWWRPGMSGVCKLHVERRTLLWILTHRTTDFLRLFLWW
ncbi:MAG: efflux RND transporter periplasmic adaptor subunit [Verrucomicrobiales bacterium]|nr:efflux RND transporter periplasmic adaptor subunit [Verrucomicrobiales bacterium]MCP5527048.1 efflux RND transporter periplasmic adaptor subunit [Verrucomicrobiales bacterium]